MDIKITVHPTFHIPIVDMDENKGPGQPTVRIIPNGFRPNRVSRGYNELPPSFSELLADPNRSLEDIVYNTFFAFLPRNSDSSPEDALFSLFSGYTQGSLDLSPSLGLNLNANNVVNLPKTQVTKTDMEICSICRQNPIVNEQVYFLPCAHAFHCDCLDEWARCKPDCPVCRMEFPHT